VICTDGDGQIIFDPEVADGDFYTNSAFYNFSDFVGYYQVTSLQFNAEQSTSSD